MFQNATILTVVVDFSTRTANVRCDAEMGGTPMDWVATIVSQEGQRGTL